MMVSLRLLCGLCLACPAYTSAGASSTPAAALEDAQQAFARADYRSAIAKLKESSDAPSLLLLGQSYAMVSDYKRATEVLERAVALDPNNSNTYLWLGRAYGHRAENAFPTSALRFASKTRDSLEKSVALNPRNWDALDDLFQYYLQAPAFLGGGTEKAARLIDVIQKHDPAEAASDRGRIAEQKKDFAAAENYYRTAVQLAPQQPRRAADLARVVAKRKASGS